MFWCRGLTVSLLGRLTSESSSRKMRPSWIHNRTFRVHGSCTKKAK